MAVIGNAFKHLCVMKYDFPIVVAAMYDRIIAQLHSLIDSLRTRFILIAWGVKFGRGCRIVGPCYMRTRRVHDVKLGNGCLFVARPRFNMVGLTNATMIDTRSGGKIIVGDNSGFSGVVMSARTLIEIGKNARVGGNVRIYDHDFHSVDPELRRTTKDGAGVKSKPVIIGNDVFIGTQAIILKGTRIGDRSIVAAGSVVFGLQIPTDSLVKGNPAQIVGRVAKE